ncbi:ABC transporter substrate-binding protein [Bauldia litoralis]|uniref:Multiple sugar transport system substrate-binding protein n=1 Tax=Bauldia litoralis TaxID=665467 RepID=A0A1G6CAX1_9HYPH|nr:extracellular solute-binding protein [Bauldia litoralis]SDB29984.1 multiple sugar transport system substrate-binding protein [Bauldia litoralis]
MKKRETGMTRRGLLQSTAGVGVAAAAGVLGPFDFARAQGMDLAATSGEPIYFRGWNFRTDVVQANVERYNTNLNGKVDYATVTGDYPSIMEKSLIANADLDVLYANPSSAVRYYGGNWIMPVDDMPNAEEIKAGMYDNIREAWSYKGKLLGLSYFVSTRGTMCINTEKFQAAGFGEEDYPKDWPELYSMLYKLRDKGEKTPYLAHWFAEWFGISWGFVFEMMNRGGVMADPETHKPMMTVDGPAGQTLEDWKKIWKDGFVPEEVLSYNEAAYIDAFRSGRYIISPQQIYDLKTFNDPEQSAAVAGKIGFLPYQGQPWGLIDSAMYLMTSRDRPDAVTDDVKKFASWYGYKNEDGQIAVAERWMKENMLFSAYKEVMESDLAKETIQASISNPDDYEKLIEVYSHTPFPKGIWSVVWSEEFNAWLREKLFAFLQQDLSVESVITEANDEIARLNKKYKID